MKIFLLCPKILRQSRAAVGGEKVVWSKTTMSGLLALCGLALLVQHVAERGPNETGNHLVAGALMLAGAVIAWLKHNGGI
jgi:hypothetical protein